MNFKKSIRTAVIAAVAALAPCCASADEGMWTISNLPQAVYQQMCAEGFSLPYSKLFTDNDAICRSVVNFGGFCSGVVVSPDGLVFTNHHCGFEAIRSHSTVEHDYMLNGFYAKSFEEELPNERLFVSFMTNQEDITSKVEALGIFSVSKERAEVILDSIENAENRKILAVDSTLRCEVKPFYEGNKYYLTTYQDFPDVRLVFAIPKSMGKFGGDTDNWMWPRQTCDYSVFRVYCDPKTGRPARYSKDNVPYHPEKWTRISMEGYKPGDFAMTMGYPGSTHRYLSSYGIQEMRDAVHEPRIKVRTARQDVMRSHMRASEAVRIIYDSKYAQSSNYWKNAIGMNKCIDSINIIGLKKQHEDMVRAWQDSTGYLKGKLDFDLLKELYRQREETKEAYTYFREAFGNSSEISTRALRYCMGMPVRGKAKGKRFVQFEDNTATWDYDTEREIFAAMLKVYRDNVKEEWVPDFYDIIDADFKGDYQAFSDYLYANSILMKNGKKIYFDKKKTDRDLAVQMGYDLSEILAELRMQTDSITDVINLQERYLCDAKLRMEMDMPHYSDANFTLRLSYGQVGGYDLGGFDSGFYTDAESIVKKMKQGNEDTADAGQYNYEYFAEPVMHDLMSASDFGKYADAATGKMHLCFLTNNDITGGNSGSPIFNGKGELLGLAFDGNWDSLSSDIFFDKKLARCIGVDIRYMVYLMDKWGNATRLIDELSK